MRRQFERVNGRPARGLGLRLEAEDRDALERIARDRQETTGKQVGAATIAREAIEQYLNRERGTS